MENESPSWKIKLPGKVPFEDTPEMIRILPNINQGALRNIPNVMLKPIRIAPNETPKFIRIAPKGYVLPKIAPNLNKVPFNNASQVLEKPVKVEPKQSEITSFEKQEQDKVISEEIMVRPQEFTELVEVDENQCEIASVETDVPINISSSQNEEPINHVPTVDKNNIGPNNIEIFSIFGPNESEDMIKMTVDENQEPMSKALNREQPGSKDARKILLHKLTITSEQFDQISKIFPYKFKSIDKIPKESKTQIMISSEEYKKLRLLVRIFPVRYNNLRTISGLNVKYLKLPKPENKKALPKPEKKKALPKPEKKKALPKPKKNKKAPTTKIIKQAATRNSLTNEYKHWEEKVLCPLCRKQIKRVNLEVIIFIYYLL